MRNAIRIIIMGTGVTFWVVFLLFAAVAALVGDD